jgi:hypothetical protein
METFSSYDSKTARSFSEILKKAPVVVPRVVAGIGLAASGVYAEPAYAQATQANCPVTLDVSSNAPRRDLLIVSGGQNRPITTNERGQASLQVPGASDYTDFDNKPAKSFKVLDKTTNKTLISGMVTCNSETLIPVNVEGVSLNNPSYDPTRYSREFNEFNEGVSRMLSDLDSASRKLIGAVEPTFSIIDDQITNFPNRYPDLSRALAVILGIWVIRRITKRFRGGGGHAAAPHH